MSSSSTRTTFIENNIHYHYKRAYIRLNSAGLSEEANCISTLFAETLDIDESQLYSTIGGNWNEYNDLEAATDRMVRSEKLFCAGNTLSDTGAALFRVGRADEGAVFCEWSVEIWDWALAAYEKEQRWKQCYSARDVKMG